MKVIIRIFLKMESAGGIVLMGAAVLAMIAANSPFKGYYDLLLAVPVEVRVGPLQIAKPLILWVNDGLMAVFFFLIGLELKREFIEGELSRPANVMLPALGALGGILVPVAIYVWINKGDAAGMHGWAIPAACRQAGSTKHSPTSARLRSPPTSPRSGRGSSAGSRPPQSRSPL